MSDAFAASYERNKACLDDYEFAVVEGGMWKGTYAKQFKNKPKPEINKIFAPINRLLGQKQRLEMNAKIISNSEEATDEDADLLQSRWRNDFQATNGAEAVNTADQEAFFTGFGALKQVAKYEDDENPDQNRQNISIEPIYSAASCVVFGPSTKKDKSDAKQAWHLLRTSRKAVEEEFGVSVGSINAQIDWFDWSTDSEKDIYIAHYYEVSQKTITIYDFNGYTVTVDGKAIDSTGQEINKANLKELREMTEHTTVRKKVKCVDYALIAGDQFLIEEQKTPFKRVPIFPQYGYYSVINGIEHYCGEVRKRRDPQMFFNTYMSSLTEILAASQVEKPEYLPEQIQRHATQRARADIDGVPYVMSDIAYDKNDNPIVGPISKQMPPQIGTGMATAGQQLESIMYEMSGAGQATVPSNASEGAIQQVNERQDDSFQPLMQNSMDAIRSLCEAWIPAAQKLYFSNQRKLRVQGADGTHSQVQTLEYGVDPDGNYGPYKNSARGKFSVQVKVGESFKSKKEAELDTTLKMLQFADTNTPQGQMLLNQAILSTTGEGGDRARKVAKFQMIDTLLTLGIDPEPNTDEEKQYVDQKIQQMQQPQQEPSPEMLFAQAEMKKAQVDEINLQTAQFKAETERMKAQADLQTKGGIEGMRLQEQQRQFNAKLTLEADKANQQAALKLTEIENKAQAELDSNYLANQSTINK